MLIGAYFTHEYSVEAAALFNPSIVLHPDQRHLGPGQSRFVMSLRAVGEGHISSIEFRSGIIDSTGALTLDLLGHQLITGKRAPPAGYDKRQFFAKLTELGAASRRSTGRRHRTRAWPCFHAASGDAATIRKCRHY